MVASDLFHIRGMPWKEMGSFKFNSKYVTGMQDCISTSQIFRKLLVLTRDHSVLSTWSFGQLISQLQVCAPAKR